MSPARFRWRRPSWAARPPTEMEAASAVVGTSSLTGTADRPVPVATLMSMLPLRLLSRSCRSLYNNSFRLSRPKDRWLAVGAWWRVAFSAGGACRKVDCSRCAGAVRCPSRWYAANVGDTLPTCTMPLHYISLRPRSSFAPKEDGKIFKRRDVNDGIDIISGPDAGLLESGRTLLRVLECLVIACATPPLILML